MSHLSVGKPRIPHTLFQLSNLLLLLVALVAISGVARAQQYSGTITGSVTDSAGASLPGATVTVTNTATNATYTATTSGIGSYSVAQLPVGTYDVRISMTNFKEAVVKGVEVHVSTNTEANAALEVGSTSQQVTVTAEDVQVQTTSAEVGEVISGTQIRELPLNGENFVGLTQLSPGVNAAQSFNGSDKGLEGGVNFSVNGNPYTNNLFLVDGVNNNDVGSNRTILVYPAVDTIAEFKMIRNSFGPEYGQASGAIISITTKSGGNRFHGGFFYAGRNDALNANDWESNHNGTGKAKERRSDYGYNISGPFKKDKLFFWWNQEWNKEIRGTSNSSCVPTAAEEAGDFSGAQASVSSTGTALDQCGATIPTLPTYAQAAGNPLKIANPDPAGLLIAQFYPTPNKALTNGNNWSSQLANHLNWSEWNVRGDYDLSKSNRATFRWTSDSWDNPAPNDGSAFWGESNYPTIDSSWSQPSKSVMAKLSSTISNTMVNDVEFGYGHNAIITSLSGTKAGNVAALQTAYPTAFPSSIKKKGEFFGGWGGLNPYGYLGGANGGGSGTTSMWNIAPYGNHEDLYTVQDNLSKVSGNHLYKGGVFYGTNAKIESNGNGADRPGLPGNCQVSNGCFSTNNPLANILLPGTASPGVPAQVFTGVGENSVDATAMVHWNDYEWYLGDTWKISRNVTVSYGFRWSFYREPFGGDDHWANFSLKNWSATEAAANPSDACNGTLVVPGKTPCQDANKLLGSLGVNLGLSSGTAGPNRALVQQNNHSIAPRVGVAWDVYGDGKMAVRVGGGQFYQRELVGIAERLANTAPFVIGISTNRSLDTPVSPSSASVSPNAAKSTGGFIPSSWQWNVSVERELARNTSIQIGYVGNAGEHLTSMYDANFIPQSNWLAGSFTSGPAQNALRPAFNFGQIGGFNRGGHATYHSLQTLFRAQTGGASTFQAAYTWSHSLGNVELDNSSGGFNQEAITDQGNPGLDKGNTNINRPNIFVASEVYFLPKLLGQNQLVQNTVGGWELNGIFNVSQGSSLSVYSSGISGGCTEYMQNSSGNIVCIQSSSLNALVGTGYTGNQRALLNSGVGCNSGTGGPNVINFNHFTLVGYAIGTFPKNLASRGSCFGSPTTNVDSQLAKNWYFKEHYRVKFSMDFFNLFNHANFNSGGLEGTGFTSSSPVYCGGATPVPSNPNGTPVLGVSTGQPCSATNNVISSASTPKGFGTTSSVHSGRELQYALKFFF